MSDSLKPPDPPSHVSTELARLIDIMRRLRDPETGCPWDVEQTFETIAPYTIEEAYEVADAVARKDMADIRDELGDLLLQVIFQSRIAQEADAFDLGDVAKSISDKMISRHPHIFASAGDVDARPSASGQKETWENIKQQERAQKGNGGVLDGIAIGLPPMLRALKLQKRAARVGFDWPQMDQLFTKLSEEINELEVELDAPSPHQDRIIDEVGDILFVAVNIARKSGVDPETALMRCNKKFENRFRYVEQQIENINKDINSATLDEMENLWQAAKKNDAK